MSETALAHYPTFQSVVALIEANRDIKLLVEVKTTLRLVSYQPGRIEFEPTERAPADLAQRLGQSLKGWTGVRWAVSVVAEGGGETIEEQQNADLAALKAEAEAHPMMQAVIAAFPSAKITEIRTREEIATEAAIEALPEVDDEWDPFEDD
jgi:DNA polymerase-3 subunit gamma/tau